MDKTEDLELGAEFIFRYPSGYDEAKDAFLFTPANTLFNGKYYDLVNHNWDENNRFQLVTKDITKDKYVYVFSIDPDNRPMIHWPRNEKLNQKFFSLNEGALVPYNKVEIVVPGRENALIKNKSGVDYLFVLYSEEPIKDLVKRIEDITTNPNDYVGAMQQTFGKRLISMNDISYQSNKMKFTTNSSSGGYIAPIILKIEM